MPKRKAKGKSSKRNPSQANLDLDAERVANQPFPNDTLAEGENALSNPKKRKNNKRVVVNTTDGVEPSNNNANPHIEEIEKQTSSDSVAVQMHIHSITDDSGELVVEPPTSTPSVRRVIDYDAQDRVRITVDQAEVDELLDEEAINDEEEEEGEIVDTEETQSVAESEVTFKIPRKDPTTPKEKEGDFRRYEGNPAFERYIQKRVAQEYGIGTKTKPPVKGQKGNVSKEFVKSPSDTTIYAPALMKTPDNRNSGNIVLSNNSPVSGQGDVNEVNVNSNLTQDIENFIQNIRLQNSIAGPVKPCRVGANENRVQAPQPQPGTSRNQQDGLSAQLDEAKEKATRMIVEAEKYKALVNTPPGKQNFLQQEGEVGGVGLRENAGARMDVDDEFFHVTCHVDVGMKGKIQRGEFIELERLLPKTKKSIDGRMDLIFKEGKSYFVPAAPDNKITGIRRWEQAFRIYAAIYSEANPSRAAEIWQYVHVINLAASTYVWDNVATYDTTFRHLMASNPHVVGPRSINKCGV